MASSQWSALLRRWPHAAVAARGRRFWSLTSAAALIASATLLAVLDGLSSDPARSRPAVAREPRLPGFTITRGFGFLSRGDLFALHLSPAGARLVPACPAGRCRPVELRLVGARAGLRPVPQDPLPVRAPASGTWMAVPPRAFASVLYEDVYPGIGLRFRGQGDELSYAFLVDRGASPDSIVLELGGVERLETTRDGGLLAATTGGAALRLPPPSAHQDTAVTVWYVVRSSRRVMLAVSEYDVRRPLAVWGGRADLVCPHR